MNAIMKDVIAGKVSEIITDEAKLCERAEEIDARKQGTLVQEITLALKATIREKHITALSAPAIGYNYRIFCIAFDHGKDIRTFLNPVIGNAEGFTLSRETCTSIPGKTFIRTRNNKIMIMYYTPMGKIESRSIAGLTARVIQHEIDHLDGLLLSDVGLEIDEQFDNATDEERAEVINAYLDSLDIRHKEIQKDIESNEDLKQANDAINFLTAAMKGDIEVEQVKIKKDDIPRKEPTSDDTENMPKTEDEDILTKEQNTIGGEVEPPKKKRGRKPKDLTDNGN